MFKSEVILLITIAAEKLVKLLVEKLVKFDENWTFQFLTNFAKIARVSLIIKTQWYNVSLWKARKNFLFWGTKFVEICEKLSEI